MIQYAQAILYKARVGIRNFYRQKDKHIHYLKVKKAVKRISKQRGEFKIIDEEKMWMQK